MYSHREDGLAASETLNVLPGNCTLGIHPMEEETSIDTRTCTRMFTAVISIKERTGNNADVLHRGNDYNPGPENTPQKPKGTSLGNSDDPPSCCRRKHRPRTSHSASPTYVTHLG